MHLRINKNSAVYRYWKEQRKEAGIGSFLNQTIICVLAFLDHRGESWQTEIALENGLSQGNLSARHMPTLEALSFVHTVERPTEGGGRASKIYQITPKGRRFLQMLRDYDGGRVVWDVTGESPYFVQGRGKNVRPSTLSAAGY